MQDQQHNLPGQIEPIADAAVGQPGEEPTQPASICPLDFSSRSRDDVLISANGDGGRRRSAWLGSPLWSPCLDWDGPAAQTGIVFQILMRPSAQQRIRSLICVTIPTPKQSQPVKTALAARHH